MKDAIRKYWKFFAVFLISFLIYYPSLFTFYTNDDFFFLKISKIENFGQFLNFFNILSGPEGFGVFRPLTTQIFYFLAHGVFDLNPIGLHVISFFVFFAVIFLVYRLSKELWSDEGIALIAAFLYAVSATHFAHLYYLATFQELGMTLFVLLSVLFFVKKRIGTSFLFFVLSLLSKETALVTPFLIALIYAYKHLQDKKKLSIKKLFISLLPFFVVIVLYVLIRIFYYGFATGDSYIWDLSVKKFINTLVWYFVWAFNMPETLLDFVGPGLHINPNLWLYWSKPIIPILSLFGAEMLLMIFLVLNYLRKRGEYLVFGLSGLWFVGTLIPVAFLPLHKFAFYLTLPLLGIVMMVGFLMSKTGSSKVFNALFLIVWLLLSIATVKHTNVTSWITGGSRTSFLVFNHFKNTDYEKYAEITFIDTEEDGVLPWSPTQTVRVALSDRNFFAVFYPNLAEKISYSGTRGILVESRQFLGY